MEENIERVKAILAEAGIKIDVGACGCCGSPWIKFEYKGEMILDSEGSGIYMFDDEQNG